jgi:hypothetical protein
LPIDQLGNVRAFQLLLVMLSEALQRNAKHEARLSNISGYLPVLFEPTEIMRFFAPLRMTAALTFQRFNAPTNTAQT